MIFYDFLSHYTVFFYLIILHKVEYSFGGVKAVTKKVCGKCTNLVISNYESHTFIHIDIDMQMIVIFTHMKSRCSIT